MTVCCKPKEQKFIWNHRTVMTAACRKPAECVHACACAVSGAACLCPERLNRGQAATLPRCYSDRLFADVCFRARSESTRLAAPTRPHSSFENKHSPGRLRRDSASFSLSTPPTFRSETQDRRLGIKNISCYHPISLVV